MQFRIERRRRLAWLPVLCALGLALAGSTAMAKDDEVEVVHAYQGSWKDTKEEAGLYNDYEKCGWGSRICLSVVTIDRRKFGWRESSGASEFRLLPGRHGIEIFVASGRGSSRRTIWFDAEEGKSYSIEYQVDGSKTYQLQIVEATTGQNVSSDHEHEDPAPAASASGQ